MTVRLVVRVHPGARRNRVRGWLDDGTLKLEVTAPPEAGRANLAVCELLASTLGVRKHQVKIVRGESSRTKQVGIEGLEDAELRRRLDGAMEDDDRSGE